MIVPRGLTVICVGSAEDSGYVRSESWRLELNHESEDFTGTQPLRVYVESTPRDRQGLWVIGDDEWAFVRQNADYRSPNVLDAMVPYKKVGGNWQSNWQDFSAALLLILPPGVGAFDAYPPPRAIVKAGKDGQPRLGMWFERPAQFSDMQNWVAEWQSYKLENGASLESVVAELNHKNHVYGSQQPSPSAAVQLADGNASSRFSWASIAVAVLGVFTGAAAIPNTALRVTLEIIALVLVAIAIAGFTYSYRTRRHSAA